MIEKIFSDFFCWSQTLISQIAQFFSLLPKYSGPLFTPHLETKPHTYRNAMASTESDNNNNSAMVANEWCTHCCKLCQVRFERFGGALHRWTNFASIFSFLFPSIVVIPWPFFFVIRTLKKVSVFYYPLSLQWGKNKHDFEGKFYILMLLY